MNPKVEMKVDGLAFEQAFLLKGQDAPMSIDPEMPPLKPVSFDRSTYHDTDLERNHLKEFWHNQAANITGVQFHLPISASPRPLASDIPDDYLVSVTKAFNKAILGAVYTEVWDTQRMSTRGMGPLKFYWEDMGDSLDDDKLSKHFSWIKEGSDSSARPKVEGEGQDLQVNEAENAGAEIEQPPMERLKARHTLCSLVSVSCFEIRTIKSKESN